MGGRPSIRKGLGRTNAGIITSNTNKNVLLHDSCDCPSPFQKCAKMASKKASETSKREVLTPIVVHALAVPGGGDSSWSG